MGDNKNVVLAVILSIVVLLGWQYFVLGPQVEQERQRQEAIRAQQADTAGATGPASPDSTVPTPGATVGNNQSASVPGAGQDRETVVTASKRIRIETDRLEGSVNLTGGRIDDLHLLKYRETVDPTSPTVVLLSPSGSANPYYAEFGWSVDGTAGIAVPTSKTVWSVASDAPLTQSDPLEMTWDNGAGLVFKQTIAIDDAYMFTVTQSVENTTGNAVNLYPYGLVSRHGVPETANFYILHEGLIGVFGEDGLQEVDYDDFEDTKRLAYGKHSEGWVGITDKYWATALVPPAGTEFQPHFTSGTVGLKPTFQSDYLSDAVTVEAGASTEITSRLFAGAKDVGLIDGYEEKYGISKFELMIDWGWFYFITKPLFFMIQHLYSIMGNFGLAMLGVTVIIKLVFFPLANKSYKSMTMMKKLQPEMMALKEKFPDDKQKQQQAMMELYKKEKINPLSGCLPILIQIPVFFALYKVLFVTIDMRHAPFFGWIKDLSAPDPTTLFNLFGLMPWDLPAWMPVLGIWPLIMGVTMFVQMKMNPAPTDATQAMIFNWMPVLFTFMLASFPAGLVIYWAWNNSLSILQQGLIMRRYGVKIELFDNIKGMFRKKQDKPAE